MSLMNGPLRDLNDLYFFAAVVEHGGFSAAGRALGIPKSRLSKRVAQLEERLGVRLLQRTTRRFVVTEVGERFYTHCRAVLEEAQAAFLGEPLVWLDERHSAIEPRWFLMNRVGKRDLFLMFTVRGDKIRVISARYMHEKEVRKYGKKIG